MAGDEPTPAVPAPELTEPQRERRGAKAWLMDVVWYWPVAAVVGIAATGAAWGRLYAIVLTAALVAAAGAALARLSRSPSASVAALAAGVAVFGALLVRAGAKEDRPGDPAGGQPLSRDEVARKDTDLRGAVIARLDLSGITLSGRHMEGVVATGARLGGAKLDKAMLSGADLVGADLRGADLHGACLRGADVTGARLNGANFEAADVERLVGAPAQPPVIGWSNKPRAGACG